MNLSPKSLRFQVEDDNVTIVSDGRTMLVDRVVRAFPKTHPEGYISFLDSLGHEIGMLETTDGMDADSRDSLVDYLRRLYFVPTIVEILSVESTGTSSLWRIITDDGERTFTVTSRESLDGDRPPEIRITTSAGQRFPTTGHWTA